MFSFTGPLDSSKSWMNRALVIQSYQPLIKITGLSESDDVKNLKQSLQDLNTGKNEFYCGAGGTTLRFFTFRVSRHQGQWTIKADERLFQRPQAELKNILQQLGVTITTVNSSTIVIKSAGWNYAETIHCDGKISSQFISGLLLNCWNLPCEMKIKVHHPIVSADYLNMTITLLQQFGLKIEVASKNDTLEISIPAKQVPQQKNILAEPDISSAFALASAAVINGSVNITNWPSVSLQPDIEFLNIFKKMKISFNVTENLLSVQKHSEWKAADHSLKETPDLFPVLAVLCSFADGISYLYGAENLQAKESDRFTKTIELLTLCGFKTEAKSSGLEIHGKSSFLNKETVLEFDPDEDHRMAMAAGLLNLAGFKINILNQNVVNKSYPQFWQHIKATS